MVLRSPHFLVVDVYDCSIACVNQWYPFALGTIAELEVLSSPLPAHRNIEPLDTEKHLAGYRKMTAR